MAQSQDSYFLAICSPFAAEAIRGFLDGRRTNDGRFVRATVCALGDLDATPRDAVVVYAKFFPDVAASLKSASIILLPEGTEATLDALWSRSPEIRESIERKTQRLAQLRHGISVTAVQSLPELLTVLPLVANSPNTAALRAGKFIVIVGLVAATGLIVLLVWALYD